MISRFVLPLSDQLATLMFDELAFAVDFKLPRRSSIEPAKPIELFGRFLKSTGAPQNGGQ